MARARRPLVAAAAAAACAVALLPGAASAAPGSSRGFVLEGATIASITSALARGSLTCERLVDGYLARIAAYEDAGPALNSLITVAPDARQQARALDARYRRRGPVGDLHCVPVVLKDNIDTADMPTTGGSKALAGSVPPQDATITRRLRKAGALVLAKGNLDEWAHGGQAGYSSVNGQTRNPYDLTRSPAGSSGGPGAAVAAEFAVLGVGTDTLGSLRGPINAEQLAGVKPTLGLVSGAGVIPFALTFDVAGPMTRTVEDSARALDVLAGTDRQDPRTAAASRKVPDSYTAGLRRRALRGVRVGVLRTYVTGSAVPAVDAALQDMEDLGAEIVDGIQVPASVQALQGQYYTFISETEFKNQLGEYLRTRRPGAPVQSHADVLAASEAVGFGMAPSVLARLRSEATRGTLTDPDYLTAVRTGPAAMRAGIDALLAANDVDVLVHATSAGSALASLSGYPAAMVPAGTTAAGEPVGLSFLGTAFTEADLLAYAYAYEQATLHRTTPPTTPPLRSRPSSGSRPGHGR